MMSASVQPPLSRRSRRAGSDRTVRCFFASACEILHKFLHYFNLRALPSGLSLRVEDGVLRGAIFCFARKIHAHRGERAGRREAKRGKTLQDYTLSRPRFAKIHEKPLLEFHLCDLCALRGEKNELVDLRTISPAFCPGSHSVQKRKTYDERTRIFTLDSGLWAREEIGAS